jgi:hypothetical protein
VQVQSAILGPFVAPSHVGIDLYLRGTSRTTRDTPQKSRRIQGRALVQLACAESGVARLRRRSDLHPEGFFEALGVGEHVDVREDVVSGLVLRFMRDFGETLDGGVFVARLVTGRAR